MATTETEWEWLNLNLTKPAVAGLTALAIDKWYFKEENMERSMFFAGSVAGGIFAGNFVGAYAPNFDLPLLQSGKPLEQRLLEISAGASSAYAVNKFVLKNELPRNEMWKRLATIAVCDAVGQTVADVMSGVPISLI